MADSELPIGPPVDATPARRPGDVTLDGRFGRVVRLAPHHAESLWQGLRGHDHVWTFIPYGPFVGKAAFNAWFETRLPLEDPYCYAIESEDGRALGIAALMEIRLAMRSIEVGHIVLTPALQRTPLATEAQYLLARYAFEELGNRRYEWKCNALNAPSRRAALRFGFSFEGILRQHMIVKGRSRDTAYYSMLESEWPARKLAFERWLSAENFTGDGKQKQSLADVMRVDTDK
jgi:RimJ/RimL family protein N-acetyltransferase